MTPAFLDNDLNDLPPSTQPPRHIRRGDEEETLTSRRPRREGGEAGNGKEQRTGDYGGRGKNWWRGRVSRLPSQFRGGRGNLLGGGEPQRAPEGTPECRSESVWADDAFLNPDFRFGMVFRVSNIGIIGARPHKAYLLQSKIHSSH